MNRKWMGKIGLGILVACYLFAVIMLWVTAISEHSLPGVVFGIMAVGFGLMMWSLGPPWS